MSCLAPWPAPFFFSIPLCVDAQNQAIPPPATFEFGTELDPRRMFFLYTDPDETKLRCMPAIDVELVQAMIPPNGDYYVLLNLLKEIPFPEHINIRLVPGSLYNVFLVRQLILERYRARAFGWGPFVILAFSNTRDQDFVCDQQSRDMNEMVKSAKNVLDAFNKNQKL